jgi:hypothetical protein
VDFGGRHGFARLAFEAAIPLYPLAVCGSAWTAPVLWRSTWLLPRLLVVPHLLGLKRWPLSLLGVLGAAAAWCAAPGPWGAAVGVSFALSPLSMVPWWPARITFRVGIPVEPSSDAAETARRVEASVQRLVDLGHGGDGGSGPRGGGPVAVVVRRVAAASVRSEELETRYAPQSRIAGPLSASPRLCRRVWPWKRAGGTA